MGGYTSATRWTDIVRRTGHESVVQRDPLDEPEALGLIEGELVQSEQYFRESRDDPDFRAFRRAEDKPQAWQ